MRPKYKVTLVCEDGTRRQVVVYADSPQHAEKKAKDKLKPASLVIEVITEEVRARLS
jgi:hypothetical protein